MKGATEYEVMTPVANVLNVISEISIHFSREEVVRIRGEGDADGGLGWN